MQYATLTRKANFIHILDIKYGQITNYLTEAESYYKRLQADLQGTNEQEIHNATILMGLVSWFEGFLNDVIGEFLICFPIKLDNKSYKIKDIIKDGSITNTIKNIIERRVADISYQNINDMFKDYSDYLSIDFESYKSDLVFIQEIKATRNIYIHNNGLVNSTYLDTAGAQSRTSEINTKLIINKTYIENVFALFNKFLKQFYEDIRTKYIHFDKTYVFKEMWNNSYFKTHSMHSECWEYQENILTGSTEAADTFGWSSSEQLLYNFYRSIYYGFDDNYKVDFPELFKKWPPESNDGQLVMTWLDNPFYF